MSNVSDEEMNESLRMTESLDESMVPVTGGRRRRSRRSRKSRKSRRHRKTRRNHRSRRHRRR
jgi:hypothetical protein